MVLKGALLTTGGNFCVIGKIIIKVLKGALLTIVTEPLSKIKANKQTLTGI
jgi:hypothetical protein